MGGKQKPYEMWQAGNSLAASPLANSSRASPERNIAALPPLARSRIPPATQARSYFAFVVETFSELVHTIPRSRNSCVTILSVPVSSRQNAQPVIGLGKFLRILILQIQNNFYNRFAIPNKHQILSIHFDETFCGNSVIKQF